MATTGHGLSFEDASVPGFPTRNTSKARINQIEFAAMGTPATPQADLPTPSQAEVEYRALNDYLERLVRWSAIAISTIVITLIQVGNEFEKDIQTVKAQGPIPEYALFPSEGINGRKATHTPVMLMGFIRGPVQVSPKEVAAAFYLMKEKLGWDVQTFDFAAAEKWCAAHKPTCDQ